MTVDPELLELMQTPVTIERFTGTDGFGNNQYASGATVRCRVEKFRKTTAVTDSRHGSTKAAIGASCQLIIDYQDPPFSVKDRVTMQDDTVMEVTDSEVVDDENGPYYQTLDCSNNQEGTTS